MIILNGTKNCMNLNVSGKEDNLPPPLSLIHGQLTENSNHLWYGNCLLSLPQNVQENNSVTPKMLATHRVGNYCDVSVRN